MVEESGDETHYTCTSTPLENTPGSKREYISTDSLDKETLKRAPLAQNSFSRLIQREQTIRKSKIKKK